MKNFLVFLACQFLLYFIQSAPMSYSFQGRDWTGVCSSGNEQSPINIVRNQFQFRQNSPLYLWFSKVNQQTSLNYLGYTYQADGNFMNIIVTDFNGAQRGYQAIQFHIHSYAEHTFDGQRADMEIHVVCKETDSSIAINGANGRYLIALGFQFNNTNASTSSFSSIDLSQTNTNIQYNFLNQVGQMVINKQNEVGTALQYFAYAGSLTKPTCMEVAYHYIIDATFTITYKQLQIYRNIFVNNANFTSSQGNYRIIQPLNGRTVYKGYINLTDKFILNIKLSILFTIISIITIILN